MKTKNILLCAFLLLFALCARKAEAQASISTTPVFNPASYTPCVAQVNVDSTLVDGAVYSAGSIDLPLNESIKFNFAFTPSEPTMKHWDEWFSPSNLDDVDKAKMIWGGFTYGDDQNDDYGQRWFPQQLGPVTVAYQVAWHDMEPGVYGVPRYVDKSAPPQVETIQITINVVAAQP